MKKIYCCVASETKQGRFRPISLSSCSLKVMKKLIKARLERFIKLDLLIPNIEFGFRKEKS